MNPIERWIIEREVKKMFQLGKTAHGIVQILLVIVQLATALSGFIPTEYKAIAAAGIALIQALYAYLNHGDSTTAKS